MSGFRLLVMLAVIALLFVAGWQVYRAIYARVVESEASTPLPDDRMTPAARPRP